MSTTVTVKLQLDVLPFASVAVQVTVVVPNENVLPDAGEQAKVTPGQLSVAVAVWLTTAVQTPGAVFARMFAGHVTTGGSASITVTVNEQVAGTPMPFDAVQFTVVVPTGNVLPEAGVQMTVGAGVPLAVTEYVTTAEQFPTSLFCVMFAGQVITGGESAVV